ncbi:hypothetical protein GZH49_08530 [Nocardia terpenica]|uniref:Uncharacterized protein n=1 Tax=Nocardia terpenica TaxID=455432 RepID=A0A291RSQ0_9NOCA|nr:hypothetical protein CRH09_32875 [Nocardia terpenica]
MCCTPAKFRDTHSAAATALLIAGTGNALTAVTPEPKAAIGAPMESAPPAPTDPPSGSANRPQTG